MTLATKESTIPEITPQLERPRYSIVVPAYNERRRLGRTLEQILAHLRQASWSAEVVIVDDGSRDDTFQIANDFASANPQVRVIQNPGNQGKGYSVRNGMLNARGEILLFTDADLSSPIAEAGKLFSAMEQGADVPSAPAGWIPRFSFSASRSSGASCRAPLTSICALFWAFHIAIRSADSKLSRAAQHNSSSPANASPAGALTPRYFTWLIVSD